MASELRVNTLKDASGNNSIATSFVAQGSAKAWLNLDGSATFDVSDTEINDSFNVGSTVDNGTGDYSITFTSTMADGNYAFGGTTRSNNASSGTRGPNGIMSNNATVETGSGFRILSARGSTASSDGALQDSSVVMVAVNGDLA
tara:strand:+ start:635 stop:1066 length:432 start_codon:yes stop_codon:yes gene_type:complete